MSAMKTVLPAVILALTAARGLAGEAAFSAKPAVARTNGKAKIAFALRAGADVEVAVLNAKGEVVRHLAAGLLGGKTPPPSPLKPGLSQRLVWDGKDDYGEKAEGGPFRVRVRAGMGVKLKKIVGGDPYAFWTEYTMHGDHSQWRVAGLEAKSDGSVYVKGNTSHHAGSEIRRYDAVGNYVRTVFPPPAGMPLEQVKGWGVNVRSDGTYTLRNSRQWITPQMSGTIVANAQGSSQLIPSPGAKELVLMGNDFRCMTLGTDSALSAYKPRPFFGSTALPPQRRLRGPRYTALSPDGKQLYVSGIHSFQRKRSYGRIERVDTTGFWREGQVWKMDLASRTMSVFFAMDEGKVIGDMKSRAKVIGDMNYINPCAAFHGVAVDGRGRVFVCDRQNGRIVVLDGKGKLIREIPNVAYPDAIGVGPKSKALYVTTRFGNYSGRGKLRLLKFNDWSKDSAPAVTETLSTTVGKKPHHSFLAVAEHEGRAMVWVAYTTLPVRVYRDTGTSLELVKDFYKGGQRFLDTQNMEVDRKTEDVYLADCEGNFARIRGWESPKFEFCTDSTTKKRIRAASIAIDARNRYVYTHPRHVQGVYRYRMDGDRLVPAPAGSAGHQVTPGIACHWGFHGLSERGMAAAPWGGLATLGVVKGTGRMTDYSGPIYYFKPDPKNAPWKPLRVDALGKRAHTNGIRFDRFGNLYVGVYDGKVENVPPGYAKDRDFRNTTARIYRYAPTGRNGDLFSTAPPKPAKIYSVHYGPIAPKYTRALRFGVDGYGRIYYPSGMMARVSVIDNEGNPVLSFGSWGNRDSMGGLDGDLVPTKDVPMAWPSSVDATDDYVYVSDLVNIRVLRLAKTFAASKTADIR